MTIYSDFPGRRAAQLVGDVVTAALVVLSIWIGVVVHDTVVLLAQVGKAMEDAGNGFTGTMTDAGDTLGGVPLIGDGIRAPFDAASDAGSTLAQAGADQQAAVGALATALGVAVSLGPIVLVLLIWAVTRLRFVRAATELRALSRLPEGAEVLALRALTTARARSLRGIGEAPVLAWRERRPAAIAALAALELRDGGLRPDVAR
jgi:hypothetical protein